MSGFDYIKTRATADRLIQKFGMQAVLRRATDSPTDRECWIVVESYDPADPASSLANPTDRKVYISAGLGDVPGEPPDSEQDQLITFIQPPTTPPVQNEILVFTKPIKPIEPAGVTCVYQASVRR